MKILLAGASGAIGQPLVDLLVQEGHDIHGMTQSKERALIIAGKGGKPVIVNVLEREALFSVMAAIKPDIVIDMLTHLPKDYTPEAMRQAAEMDAKIRSEGGGNLHEAALAHAVKRYIVQSTGFWYEPGTGLADENTPFAFDAPPPIDASVRLYSDIEKRVLENTQMEGVALRFGFFYGPKTWFHPSGSVAKQIRSKQFPIIGSGEGVWNFIHIEDAAKAARSAIYCLPGAYNVVNDHPAPMREWLPALARYLGAERPSWISQEEGLKIGGEGAVYYATKLRGASNLKAKREFNFQPRNFEWFV